MQYTNLRAPLEDDPLERRGIRIQNFTVTDETFSPAYVDRFVEGEFRKRIQFMFGGKLERKRFCYVGPSLEAVLDRLATARIIEPDEDCWLIEAGVYGNGIDMWLRGQGDFVIPD